MSAGTRSTKGASKQRRDSINVEIQKIKQWLPVSEGVRRRLSQLQVMALCNTYVAKTIYFQNAVQLMGYEDSIMKDFDFNEALPGFLVVATMDGTLLYVSENVTEYFGHSMVEVLTQADSLYDILDKRDHFSLRSFLSTAGPHCSYNSGMIQDGFYGLHGNENGCSSILQETLELVCSFDLTKLFRRNNNMFDRQKRMKLRGRMISPEGELSISEPLFVGMFSSLLGRSQVEPPIATNTNMFRSNHSLDMKFSNIDSNGEFHLGYTKSEVAGRSWYAMVHPEDSEMALNAHVELVNSGGDSAKSLLLRLQTAEGHYVWIHCTMRIIHNAQLFPGSTSMPCPPQEILCVNNLLSETEAMTIRNLEEQQETSLFEGKQTAEFMDGVAQIPDCAYPDNNCPGTLPLSVIEESHAEERPLTEDTVDRAELIRKIRQKAEMKYKRARVSGSKVLDTQLDIMERNQGQMNCYGQFVTGGTSSTLGQAALQTVGFGGPLTPPYSDDGMGDHSAHHVTNLSENLAAGSGVSPPYSPPNDFVYTAEGLTSSHPGQQEEEVSFFAKNSGAVAPVQKYTKSDSQRKRNHNPNDIQLPELDQRDVESFLQFMEEDDFLVFSAFAMNSDGYQGDSFSRAEQLIAAMSSKQVKNTGQQQQPTINDMCLMNTPPIMQPLTMPVRANEGGMDEITQNGFNPLVEDVTIHDLMNIDGAALVGGLAY